MPVNSKQRHSSEIIVAVVDDFQVKRLDRREVRVDCYRASGKGGQNRNKVETAIRLTHVPSGIVVTATEQRTKGQNLAVAWRRLQESFDKQSEALVHSHTNSIRQQSFDADRRYTWTDWRNEVKLPSGSKANMSKVLSGKLELIL